MKKSKTYELKRQIFNVVILVFSPNPAKECRTDKRRNSSVHDKYNKGFQPPSFQDVAEGPLAKETVDEN